MEKKILLPVDDSTHSKRAIEYAVKMSSLVKNLSYTLFHVQPTVSSFLLEAAQRNVKTKQKLAKLTGKNREQALRILEKYKQDMLQSICGKFYHEFLGFSTKTSTFNFN